MVILTSFPPPSDGVRHKQENTKAHVQGKQLGNGVLFVAESRLSWMGVSGEGFSLEYPAITLHAISRDTTSFPHDCIFLMVEGDLGRAPEQNGTAESSDEDDDASSKTSEIRFVPDDKISLENIYRAMSECQLLHPDENESFSDDDVGEDYDDAEEGDEVEEGDLTPAGQEQLARMDAMLAGGDNPPATNNGDDEPMETAQFDDAD